MTRLVLVAGLAILSAFVPAQAAAGQIELSIRFSADASATPRRFVLRCGERASGTVPRPADACRRLRKLGASAFRPTPPGVACTELSGGPSRARITGSFLGRPVWVSLRLENGCEIARWQRVGFLLPPPAAPG